MEYFVEQLISELEKRGIRLEEKTERIYLIPDNVGEWMVATCVADVYEGDEELTAIIDEFLQQAGVPIFGIDVVIIDLGGKAIYYGYSKSDLKSAFFSF